MDDQLTPRRAQLSRRTVASGAAALAAGAVLTGPAAAAKGRRMTGQGHWIAYTGCRTTRERNARGDGIGVYRVDRVTGRWDQVQLVSGLFNPSFLAFDRTRRVLFTVHGDGTEASAFSIDPATGQLTFLNKAATGGRNPVHLAVDPTNRFLVIANHIVADGVRSGLASLPIAADGKLAAPVDVVAFDGKIGPHRVEQPFPKPHQAEFDPTGRFIVVPDKGCDRVRVFQLDAAGRLAERAQDTAPAREASGPRHVAFHPGGKLAYVINELDSTVVAYRFDPATGALAPFQVVSALPDTFTGNSRASEIAVSADGRFVYGSNRGSDSVAVFAVDAGTGRLAPRGWAPSGGKTPRFFTLAPDGDSLFVANEESDSIVRFRRASDTGLLSGSEVVAHTGSPTCILFAA